MLIVIRSQAEKGQNRVIRGMQVTQRSAGANFSVDISAGTAVILGTTQADQGAYMVRSTAVENQTVPATPAQNQTDSLYAIVNDPNAGGDAGDDFEFKYVSSGGGVPDDSILLATIARATNESAITDATIFDARPLGEWSWTVGTSAPTHNAPPGDLFVLVAP